MQVDAVLARVDEATAGGSSASVGIGDASVPLLFDTTQLAYLRQFASPPDAQATSTITTAAFRRVGPRHLDARLEPADDRRHDRDARLGRDGARQSGPRRRLDGRRRGRLRLRGALRERGRRIHPGVLVLVRLHRHEHRERPRQRSRRRGSYLLNVGFRPRVLPGGTRRLQPCPLGAASSVSPSPRSDARARHVHARRKCTDFGRDSASSPSTHKLTPRPESFHPLHGMAGSR